MKDKQLREAFRSLNHFLNLKTELDIGYYGDDYETRNYPNDSSCNIARKSDINNLQDQINELKKPNKKKVKKK